jgi:hypothetical protein
MKMQIPETESKRYRLIQDAARWLLISMLFDCPSDGWRESLTALACEVPDPDLKEAASSALAEASEGLYHSLFGPGSPASPREVSYHRGVESGRLISEVTGYYNAFGYSPPSMEACDHIAVETGFVGYLRLKEAYAEEREDAEHAAISADAARRFIEDHISVIAGPLGDKLQGAGIHYLALAGRALVQNLNRQS